VLWPLASTHRELVVTTGQEGVGSGLTGMHREKIGARDTVAVGKDKVVCIGSQYGFVEDTAFSEAIVFLPEMPYIQVRFPLHPLYEVGRFASGAVVANDDFENPCGTGRCNPRGPFPAKAGSYKLS